MFERILVPTDFSSCAEQALEVALHVAEKFDATITLMHACEPPSYAYAGAMAPVDLVTPVQDAAREMTRRAFADLKRRYAKADCVLAFGTASMEILACVDKHAAELVVIGSRGRTAIGRVVLGSVAARIVRLAPVPVLTVRQRKK